MPTLQCTGCGYTTNTAVSRHDGETASECYARFLNDTWERGCGYDNAMEYERRAVDDIIKTCAHHKELCDLVDSPPTPSVGLLARYGIPNEGNPANGETPKLPAKEKSETGRGASLPSEEA